MLDLKWIRENPELVRHGLAAKNVTINLDILLQQDAERRKLLTEVENLKSQRNNANEQIVTFKKSGQNAQAEAIIAGLKTTSQKINEIDAKVGEFYLSIQAIMANIPNIPHSDVPVAKGPLGNKVVRSWG